MYCDSEKEINRMLSNERVFLRYFYRTFLITQILFRQMYTVLCYSTQLFIKDCPTCFEPIQGSSSGAYLLKLHQPPANL
jgi:hypothetical protein